MVADPLQGTARATGADRLAAALRRWMGDAMDTEKVPAKCAARLGQCFSNTVDGAVVQQHQVVSNQWGAQEHALCTPQVALSGSAGVCHVMLEAVVVQQMSWQ